MHEGLYRQVTWLQLLEIIKFHLSNERVFFLFFSCLSWPKCDYLSHQASEEASLRALESLMTEFFYSCTTNERKREIGKCVTVKLPQPLHL